MPRSDTAVRLRVKYVHTIVYARCTSLASSASCVPDIAQPCKPRLCRHLVAELLPDAVESEEAIRVTGGTSYSPHEHLSRKKTEGHSVAPRIRARTTVAGIAGV